MPETPVENPSEQSSSQPPANNRRMMFIVVALTILVLLFLLAASVVDNIRQSIHNQPTPSPIAENPTPTPDETVNWKTYTNTKYNYRIQYPSAWTVKEGVFAASGVPNYGYNNDVYVSVHEKKFSYHDNTTPSDDSLESYIKYIESEDVSTTPSRIPESITKITTKFGHNGYLVAWKKTNGQFGPAVKNDTTFFALPNDVNSTLQIETSENRNHLDIYKLMISTFKFIDASPSAMPKATATPTESGNGEGIACTQEAKLCPDGSYVGRTGPNCEFAKCQ